MNKVLNPDFMYVPPTLNISWCHSVSFLKIFYYRDESQISHIQMKLLKPHHQIILCHRKLIGEGGVTLPQRCIFYNPSQLGWNLKDKARTDRPKSMDSEAVPQAIETVPMSSTHPCKIKDKLFKCFFFFWHSRTKTTHYLWNS